MTQPKKPNSRRNLDLAIDRLCAQTGIPKQLHNIEEVSKLAARLFDCALDRHCDGLRWSHADLDRKQVPAH